jgi:hypothetical protein
MVAHAAPAFDREPPVAHDDTGKECTQRCRVVDRGASACDLSVGGGGEGSGGYV